MAEPATYGGQAVIEGVMMRGPRYFAVACRRPGGEILVRGEPVPAFFTRYRWARWPLFRGVFALADALVLGMKSLLYSARLAADDAGSGGGGGPGLPAAILALPVQWMLGAVPQAGGMPGPSGSIVGVGVAGSFVLGMSFGIGLFVLLPSVLAGWATPWVGPTLWRSVLEGAVRVALVLGYLAAVGRMKEIRRLFQYHGAEHQAINAWEQEGRLDVEAAMRASRIHPRCGTNFILTVLLVKALLFTAIPWQESWALRLGSRLLLLPVVAALAYEVIRLAGRYRGVRPLQWLVAPGLATQLLTTRPPDREMVEVAVVSLRSVMEREGTLPAGA